MLGDVTEREGEFMWTVGCLAAVDVFAVVVPTRYHDRSRPRSSHRLGFSSVHGFVYDRTVCRWEEGRDAYGTIRPLTRDRSLDVRKGTSILIHPLLANEKGVYPRGCFPPTKTTVSCSVLAA